MSTPLVIVVSETPAPVLVTVASGPAGPAGPAGEPGPPVLLRTTLDGRPTVPQMVQVTWYGPAISYNPAGLLHFAGMVNGAPSYQRTEPGGLPKFTLWRDDFWYLTVDLPDDVATGWIAYTATDAVPQYDWEESPFNDFLPPNGNLEIETLSPQADAAQIGQLCRYGDAPPYEFYIAETAGAAASYWRKITLV